MENIGIELPVGWWSLALNCREELREKFPDIQVLQAKEKYGAMRIYVDAYEEEAERIISKYESLSKHTCYRCGGAATASYQGMPVCEECKR